MRRPGPNEFRSVIAGTVQGDGEVHDHGRTGTLERRVLAVVGQHPVLQGAEIEIVLDDTRPSVNLGRRNSALKLFRVRVEMDL